MRTEDCAVKNLIVMHTQELIHINVCSMLINLYEFKNIFELQYAILFPDTISFYLVFYFPFTTVIEDVDHESIDFYDNTLLVNIPR